ncbi:MAG: YciI family protein [Lapillicoccus sp.]
MTEYAILLPGVEDRWATATDEQRAATYARHGEFAAALAERGHTVTDGAELTHSKEAKVVRGTAGDVTVTDGPYAETVEQLTGFYIVRSDNIDDLLDVCGILLGSAEAPLGGAIEVRACAPSPEEEPPDAVPPPHCLRGVDVVPVDGGALPGVLRCAPRLRAGGECAWVPRRRRGTRDHRPGLHRAPRGRGVAADRGPVRRNRRADRGFYVVDLPDELAAQEVAQHLPRQYIVEVRPEIDIDGYERSAPATSG